MAKEVYKYLSGLFPCEPATKTCFWFVCFLSLNLIYLNYYVECTKHRIHTCTSLFSATIKVNHDEYSIRFNDNTSAKTFRLINCRCLPKHVFMAVLTLPVLAHWPANTKYDCGFSH